MRFHSSFESLHSIELDSDDPKPASRLPFNAKQYSQLSNDDDFQAIKKVSQLSKYDDFHAVNVSPPESLVAKTNHGPSRIGLLYMIISTILFCTSSMSIKALYKNSEQLPTLQIVFIRGCLGSIVGLMLLYKYNIGHYMGPIGTRKLLLLRGILGFLAVVSGYWAINLLSVGDATVVGFLSPVFTGIAGQVFLGERWDTTDRIAGACSLVGITLIARPVFIFGNIFGDLKPDVDGSIISPRLPELGRVIPSIDGYPDSEPQNYSQAVWNQTIASSSVLYKRTVNISETRILGALAGVVSAIFVAGSMIAIRKASSKAHALHIITAFHVTAIPLVLVSNALLPKFVEPLPWVFPEKVLTWTFLFMATFGGLGGQLCIGLALQLEKAGKAMAISYIQAVFAFLAEFLVWGVIPHWLSIIGGLIVIFCVSMVALLKKAA